MKAQFVWLVLGSLLKVHGLNECLGHCGLYGDDTTPTETSLRWCCESCNCRDLGDKADDSECALEEAGYASTCAIEMTQCEGHYGVGGDDATMSDPELQWCCNRCNCKDLDDKADDSLCVDEEDAECEVTLYSGVDGTGTAYGSFPVGEYTAGDGFTNDGIRSLSVTATGLDDTTRCRIRLTQHSLYGNTGTVVNSDVYGDGTTINNDPNTVGGLSAFAVTISDQTVCEGHYGTGGDDATISDEDLQWCCYTCNCKDLSDKADDWLCEYEECSAPATFVWEELITSATDKPSVTHELEIDATSLTLSIHVEADYLGKTTADNNGEVYGTTYVIDFEDFNAHSDDIREPGTCQNRDGDDFEDPTWDEVWAFSETPNAGHVGGVDYLAYPRSNWWTVAMSSDDVCTVTYSASFTWAELMDCKSYDEKTPYITSTDNDDDITLQGTLYINVVSPFDYKEDYGYYRVYQLVSQPFEIVISKTVYVLGDVGINLLTMDIIAVYKEGEENTFRLIVLTESAEYLRLSREGEGTEYLQVFAASDVDNEIESSNFATLEAAETGTDCLGNKDYICTQLWQITASDVQCTTDGIFTDFSGTYSIQFNAVCRDDVEDALFDYCEGWLLEHEDEIVTDDKVLLQADLAWKDEICDPEIFEVQFAASMEFYYGSFGTELPDDGHLFQVGEDTVYVKISTEYPSDHYDVFETTLMNVWICTFDPLTDYDSIIAVSDVGAEAGGCFADEADNSDGKFDDHIYSLEYGGPQVDDFVLDVTTTALASNEIQFEFLVPGKVERDTLYIHAEIEVSLGSGRRRRVLLSGMAMANQMEHFVDRIPIGSSPKPKPVPQAPVHHPKHPFEAPAAPVQQPWVISLQSPWVMAIGALLALVLTVNIVFMCYTNCVQPMRNRSTYSPVKVTDTDSEFDAASSERDAINVISE